MITKSDDAVTCRHSVNCCDLNPDMQPIFVVVVALSTIVIQEHMLVLSGGNLTIMKDRGAYGRFHRDFVACQDLMDTFGSSE